MTDQPAAPPFMTIVTISLSGWFLYVCSDTMTKWLTQSYPVPEILLIVYGIGLACIVGWLVARHGLGSLKPPKWRLHALRGGCTALGSLLGVEALHRIPLTDFYGVVFVTPLLICLMSHFILKERIGRYRLSAIVVGFIGVLILAGPKFANADIGYIFALVAALMSASNGICVRKIGPEPIVLRFALFVFLGNVLLNAVLLAHTGGFVMPRWSSVPLFASIPFVILGGLLAYSVSFSRVRETAMIAPFHYSQIIWGTVAGYVLFGNAPTLRTLIGAAIIIGAGLYMIWREHVLHKASVLRVTQR